MFNAGGIAYLGIQFDLDLSFEVSAPNEVLKAPPGMHSGWSLLQELSQEEEAVQDIAFPGVVGPYEDGQ